MSGGKCAICGISGSGSIKEYPVIPENIVEEAGLKGTPKVKVCPGCWRELEKWFASRVADTAFDTNRKQFLPKPPRDLAREYEVSYEWFVRNRGAQLRKAQGTLL